jgi:signal transduction histidine kinase
VSRYLNPAITIKDYQHYSMHIFGFIAFLFTFGLGIIALIKHIDTDHENLALYLPYGILIFFLNLFYLKAIRLSREDYEAKLKKEKEYSQALLHSQKRFLRYAVHETNTPLAVIMANIELYEMEEGKHQTLKNIEAATKNIFGIYDDLSYLTQQDKIEYPKQYIVLSEFIQSRIAFFNIVAVQSDLCFEMIDSTQKAQIFFNETKLQRIIDNNITNAIKYTMEGKVIHIILSTHHNKICFEITSNSTKIEDTSHIFDAYYREDHIQEGLGLGLNLVRDICKSENVHISLTSTEENTSFIYHFTKAEL